MHRFTQSCTKIIANLFEGMANYLGCIHLVSGRMRDTARLNILQANFLRYKAPP
ncbi:hypothetical protein GGD46_002340 [Rhizobium lusitanum]|uniref:Uncharacterized protein n=1 Tax=Rhizobium lusitanum TaxID=293958 RepID=A0A7X0IQ84_9HYPH|nr:hypothetical protein [Rhizobium lusitanum]